MREKSERNQGVERNIPEKTIYWGGYFELTIES
jgi:hypothetical protein